MKYKDIVRAKFIKRLNRFVAELELNDEKILCHVKNTGRCKELLVEGVTVYLEKAANPGRKYKYSLISVQKGERLINMDSSAPNKAVREWLEKGEYFKNITCIKPESTFGKSRLDFYFEYNGKRAYAEVKGVTLEKDNVVSFPDAPTQRGVKHIRELCECLKEGYEAYIIFVVQMKNASYFEPNADNDPDFAAALKSAAEKGVKVLCFECEVTKTEMNITKQVRVQL